MKCVILAAGYATRLYPLTENFPKPLLEVGGKPILDWLLDDLDATGRIDGYIVISNHKFAPVFEDWAARRNAEHPGVDPAGRVALSADPGRVTLSADPGRVTLSAAKGLKGPVTVLDDGTTSNETRLGAVRDIQFAIDRCGLDDDLLVMAGDNLLSFSLSGFLDYAAGKGTSCVMRYYEPELAKLRKTGVAEVDGQGRILSMEEKPAEPKSHWCCPPFYVYRREDVPLVAAGIRSGCGVDAPGSFIAWLAGQTPVHAWEMPGCRYDIGNLESYEQVRRIFA